MAITFEPTGNATVDSLKGLQLIVDTLENPKNKLAHIQYSLGRIGASSILEHKFMVNTAEVWATPPLDSRRFIHLPNSLFIAELDTLGYLLDPSVPVDTLSLNFREPEVWGIDPEDALAFRDLRFQVPVLAIDSCLDVETA